MRNRFPVPLLAFAVALAAAGYPSNAGAAPDRPTLAVQVVDEEYPELEIALDFEAAGEPAAVSLYAPQAFELYPARSPGQTVGRAIVYAGDSSYGATGVSILTGRIVGGRLDPLAEALAQSCSPGEHVAVWRLQLSLLGQPLEIPIYLSLAGTGAPPGSFLKLDFCAPALPSADPAGGDALPILGLTLALDGIPRPRAAGLHVWRALVTPLAPDQRGRVPERAYEVRGTVPVPHAVTLAGRYAAKERRAVVTGRVTAAGRPRPGIPVYFLALVRRVTPTGIDVRDWMAGPTRTTANGTYRFRTRIGQTTGFVAAVPDVTGRCNPPLWAPRCLSETISGVRSEPITVSVPKPRGR